MKLFIVNDDVNSFEHVTKCIQKYLNYPFMQAASICNIIHTAGKCEVKSSSDEILIKSLYMELMNEGLNLKIESGYE
jgi:ATP-dependent Clp protease adapter protein ClpS|tara:strand:+ start:116 stop:346 length:231 start_codon:yes stop_codon:yes gene_type:complete